MTAAHLLAFVGAALLLIVVPGPSVLFVVGRALAHGRSVAVASALGGTLGSFLLAVLVAVGLGAAISRSAGFFLALKIIGGLYLCFLGVQAIRSRGDLDLDAGTGERRGAAHLRSVRQGVVVGLTNPKNLVFFAAVLPQFVVPAAGSTTRQMLIFAVIFCLIAAISDSIWGLVAARARDWFARSPRRLRAVGGAGGVTMIGLGVGLVAAGRPN